MDPPSLILLFDNFYCEGFVNVNKIPGILVSTEMSVTDFVACDETDLEIGKAL